jgi:hypothetical protein
MSNFCPFSNLPIDVLLLIRSALFPDVIEVNPTLTSSAVEIFIGEEAEWSWRNLMSVRGSSNWKQIRRHAMIWNLNQSTSKRYLTDAVFQEYIDAFACMHILIRGSFILRINCVAGLEKTILEMHLPHLDPFTVTSDVFQ